MTVKTLFPIYLFEDILDIPNIDNIKQWCLDTSDVASPLYCGHFVRSRPSIHNATPDLQLLTDQIIQNAVKSFYQMQNPKKDFHSVALYPPIFIMKRMWCNIYNKNGLMDPHNHYESPYAGTLFLNSSKACLSFYNPNQYRPNDRYKVKPEPGKVVIWPGWLTHQVDPNFSDDVRISISFKLEFILPNVDQDGRRLDNEMTVS